MTRFSTRSSRVGIGSAIALIGFAAGFVAGAFRLPPFELIQSVNRRLFSAPPKIETYGTEPETLIEIADPDELVGKREALRRFIWGSPGLPAVTPTQVERGIDDERFAGLSNLERIDRITSSQEWGLDSVAYHFIPADSAEPRTLVLYLQGHDGHFALGTPTIAALLQSGHSVVALSMPLVASRLRPIADTGRFGRIMLRSHDDLALLQPADGHPVKYFLEPVTAAVNYAVAQGYDEIAMVGFSGGAWTTTVYAALDPRISRSYPVAGPLPRFLDDSLGDFEQTVPGLYQKANYLELYVMGAHGDGRRQIQILNAYDPCCSQGDRGYAYERAIRDAVDRLGSGSYELFVDDTHREHKISGAALDTILRDLEREDR